jgi:hypothetical protein
MTRRLEGPGLGATNPGTSSARQVIAGRGVAVARRRLDEVIRAQGRSQETNEATCSDFPGSDAFRPSTANGKSLDEMFLDFVMPSISDPAILQRSVPILQHCVEHLIPGLKGGEQLRSLAKTLMQDEIERHRNLIGRLHGGIET